MCKKNKKDKNFDCVKMTREIRDKLSEEYKNNSEKLFADLKKLQKNYPKFFKNSTNQTEESK